MTGDAGRASFALLTPPPAETGGAAIAAIQIDAKDAGALDRALAGLGLPAPPPGRAALADLLGVDVGLVVRASPACAQLTPHAGEAVVHALIEALSDAGLILGPNDDPRRVYPEAVSLAEACMLRALARAASPRACEALLPQPALWDRAQAPAADTALTAQLARLIGPPLVAAVGASNIGKSTLLNALAGAAVAVVDDRPGSTRDHIGAGLVLDGLTVRWIDTPGRRRLDPSIRADQVEAHARALAADAIARADLLVLCADAWSEFPDPAAVLPPGAPIPLTLRCGLRSDRGPAAGAEIETCAAARQGLAELAIAIRRRLVPDEALAMSARTPWRFDEALPMA